MTNRLSKPYQQLDHDTQDMHPIDAYIEKHFPVDNLRKMIKETYRRLRLTLMEDSDFQEILDLERQENELRLTKQEAYFDVGYDHGFIDGSGQVFKDIHSSSHSNEYTKLSNAVRNAATQSGLPDYMKVAAVLEATWSVTMANQLAIFTSDDNEPLG